MRIATDYDGTPLNVKDHRDNCRVGRGRRPMKNRVIRVDDDTWDAAMRAADARDERLSEEIRRWLERYGKDYREKGKP